ncbi:NADH dehydrogenase [ubiquinone] flavoprotein 3, mitochondrial [Phascolarctos cinereus]|uniref:NADH dehydrogenase [ubiquinone] flavoprotein 3, mitochondrial n=1 Tax=Phascolarctos cinereus TaxID=38626 RepID=A0A6P5J853_PHACI|nr:NADH dehydrogenase [ubiquinone] flavoprotein 3, mitochondrial [Phascolarctos cinereus]
MAFSSVLGLGRGAVLKTIQLKAWGLREFASTAFLSTKSGGNEKEKQKKSKMQEPPKNVVAPQEGVKLLPSQRAEFPKNLSSPNSYPSAMNKDKTIVNINSDDIKQQTDEEIGKLLPRKTVVEFPRRVSTSSLRAKDTSLVTHQQTQKPDVSDSSSSSSDSDSDREDSVSEIVLKPQIASKTKGEFSQGNAFETKTQRTLKSTEKTQFQKAHVDSIRVEKPHQSEMKLTVEQSEAYKESKIPKSEVIESFSEQSTKEAQMQNTIFKLNEMTKENQKPVEIHGKLSDQMEGGPSTQLDTGTKLLEEKEGNREDKPTAVDFTADHFENKDILEEQVPIPNLEAPPQTKENILEENVPTGTIGAKEELAMKLKNQGIIPETESAEAFDNSTYKNLQHHDYNTYTFLDFNLDLLKFRLPQPSSGRESPRH